MNDPFQSISKGLLYYKLLYNQKYKLPSSLVMCDNMFFSVFLPESMIIIKQIWKVEYDIIFSFVYFLSQIKVTPFFKFID